MWRPVGLFCLVLLTCVGCKTHFMSAHEVLEHTDTVIKDAKVDVKDSLRTAREEYQSALAETKVAVNEIKAATAEEIAKVQEQFKKQVDDIDKRLQERLDQAKASATLLIEKSDAAVQARIDQVFAELRLFIKETLIEIRALIQPVMDFAAKATVSLDTVNKSIASITESINKMIATTTATIAEAQQFVMKLNGKQPDGTKAPVDFAGIAVGVLALVKSLMTDKKRSEEKKDQGDRWKPEEIDGAVASKVTTMIANGELDEAIKARVALFK